MLIVGPFEKKKQVFRRRLKASVEQLRSVGKLFQAMGAATEMLCLRNAGCKQ